MLSERGKGEKKDGKEEEEKQKEEETVAQFVCQNTL